MMTLHFLNDIVNGADDAKVDNHVIIASLKSESQPQNPELGRFLWLLWFNFILYKGNWSFEIEIVDICRHTACFKFWFSKVQDFRNFEITPMKVYNGMCTMYETYFVHVLMQ